MRKLLYILILPFMIVLTILSGILLVASYCFKYIFDKVEYFACCIYGFVVWTKCKILFNDKHDLKTVIYYVYNKHIELR